MDRPQNKEEQNNMILGLLELIARMEHSINLHQKTGSSDLIAIEQYTMLKERYLDELLELLQEGYGLTLQQRPFAVQQAA